MERRERFMQKEVLRVCLSLYHLCSGFVIFVTTTNLLFITCFLLVQAEKRKQKEERRRERDAARQRAAMERATARRIAKESMELIEDERLELMELAASSKGLPSILSLDYDTLQNLDSFRGWCCLL